MFEKLKFKDGVYDISNEEYHGSEGISRSQLMLLEKSPYHFWHEVLSGKSEQKESTKAKDIGALFHTMLLEPHKFEEEFCLKPELLKMPPEVRLKDVGRELFESNKRERAYVKEQNSLTMEAFNEFSLGKTIIGRQQYEDVCFMVEKIREHEIVTTLLDEAVFEQSIYWTDKETGIQFKVRPDIWAQKMAVDLKTTKEANFYSFQRSCVTYGYFLQAGMIYEACKQIDRPFDMFVHLVCEKESPYVPAVYMMSDVALEHGVNQFNELKKKLYACLSSDKWPGYPVRELEIPMYALRNDEE